MRTFRGPAPALLLGNPGNRLASQYLRLGELSSLEVAIKHVIRALPDPEFPEKPSSYRPTPQHPPPTREIGKVLGKCRVAEWRQFGALNDLDTTVKHA